VVSKIARESRKFELNFIELIVNGKKRKVQGTSPIKLPKIHTNKNKIILAANPKNFT